MRTERHTTSSGAKRVSDSKPAINKRRETRVVVSIPVRVSAIDQGGNPFSQTAQTVDVSRTGARISGVRCLRAAGDMVTVECGTRSARFMAVWIGRPGTSEEGQFGVKTLEPEKCIFRIDTGDPRPDGYVRPEAESPGDPFTVQPLPTQNWDRSERRRAPRLPCSGTGQIRQPGVAFPVWAEVTDLSSGGCYVQMVFTISRGSEVDLQLTINERTFAAKGKVVTSHPGVGMGIQFTEISQENQKALSEILKDLMEK
jgi:hypothetical protein